MLVVMLLWSGAALYALAGSHLTHLQYLLFEVPVIAFVAAGVGGIAGSLFEVLWHGESRLNLSLSRSKRLSKRIEALERWHEGWRG